jgi:hypothetical protein
MAGTRPITAPGLIAQTTRPRAKAAPAAPPEPVRWYRVLETIDNVPRKGGSFKLTRGKELNSANYDVPALEGAGVKLQEIPPPRWYLEHQAADPARHEELAREAAARGVEYDGQPAPYEPTPVRSAEKPPAA